MTIRHDYSGMSGALYDAYMYGKNERAYANQILGANIGGDQNNIHDKGFDMSNPDDESQISEPPDLLDLRYIPDESSPPDGASGATIATGEQEPDLLIQDADEEEQKKRRAEIDAEKEANTSLEEKQQLEAEEKQLQIDEQLLLAKQAEEEKAKQSQSRVIAFREKMAEKRRKKEEEAETAIAESKQRRADEEEQQRILEERVKEAKEWREKADERKKNEEAKEKEEEKRVQDELNAFEEQHAERIKKEEAELEEERASGASGATTRSTLIGTELNETNLELNIIRYTRLNNRNFSARELREKILDIEPNTDINTLDTFQSGLRQTYVLLLLKHPNRIPYFIDPRPDISALKEKIFSMTAVFMKAEILPKVMKPGIAYNKMALLPKNELRQALWDKILVDPGLLAELGPPKTGQGLTNHTIKQEGMNSDEIAQVLKKKTHHVIPVIASDQIATLLPLVNNTTKEFGFVINSQSLKKPGMHWKAIYFDRKKAEVCYFDSLVSEPTEAVLRGIKQIIRKMADPLYFKLKINRIKFQADDTSTCGPFALKFIADMYSGKQFKVATRFTDDSIDGEKSIRKYISRWNYI
jgi:hypothetical protein